MSNKTNIGYVVNHDGTRRKVSLTKCERSWMVKPSELYYIETGIRVGRHITKKGKCGGYLDLSSIREMVKHPA